MEVAELEQYCRCAMDFGCDYMDVEGLEQQCRCAVDVGCGWQLRGWNDDIGCGWQLRGWNDSVGVQYVDLGVAGSQAQL